VTTPIRCALALALASLFLPACASDTAPEPEPTLDDPGTFVGIQDSAGRITLLRTLLRSFLDNGAFLDFTAYDLEAASWSEARELAKGPDLPVRVLVFAVSEDMFVAETDYRVVWYRTLTEEEEKRAQ
jgi:hypothetical protein